MDNNESGLDDEHDSCDNLFKVIVGEDRGGLGATDVKASGRSVCRWDWRDGGAEYSYGIVFRCDCLRTLWKGGGGWEVYKSCRLLALKLEGVFLCLFSRLLV